MPGPDESVSADFGIACRQSQRGLLMEGEQRVQHRQRSVGDAERLLGLGERAKQPPFVHDGFGCTWSCGEILGRGLARHHGER